VGGCNRFFLKSKTQKTSGMMRKKTTHLAHISSRRISSKKPLTSDPKNNTIESKEKFINKGADDEYYKKQRTAAVHAQHNKSFDPVARTHPYSR
jgi:hypothetical protein